MVQLFRNSNPATFIILIIYGLLLKIPALVHQPMPIIHSPYPLTDLVVFWINKLSQSPWLQTGIALVILFAQAFYINYFLNEIRFVPKATFLPAMVYVLLSSLFNELSFFSPQLLALCFLLPVLHNVLLFYKNENVSGLLFDTAFLIGVASLFYFPAVIFLVFLLTSLLATRRINAKEWGLSILGFLIPFLLVIAFLYWTNNLGYIHGVLSFAKHYFLSVSLKNIHLQLIVMLIVLSLLFVWSFLVIRQNFFKQLVQWRIYVNIVLVQLVFAVIVMIFGLELSPASLWFIIVPLSVMVGYNFAELKQVRWAEYAHLLVILLIIVFNFKFIIGK